MTSSHTTRIRRLARKFAERAIRRNKRERIMMRKPVSAKPRLHMLVAYDLETSSIKAGTPHPLYITAYGDDGFYVSQEVRTIEKLGVLVRDLFLQEEYNGARYVAWFGNNFDVYFIAAGLLNHREFVVKPYLTAGNNLRGIRVFLRDSRPLQSWEFLDGAAMTGVKWKLDKFLETFAPKYRKLDAPDWEHEEFDPDNDKHRRYAERDSEGLYHALKRAQDIVMEHFGMQLQPTIGNFGIKAFQAHIPFGIRVHGASADVDAIIRTYVMRGGFCYAARRYAGPVWKYDINQAYAAAMRDADLPAGRAIKLDRWTESNVPGFWFIEAWPPATGNLIPFYHRDRDGLPCFSFDHFVAWLTSIEVRQLKAEGWKIKVYTGYWYDSCFSMSEYVNKLEALRIGAPGGPKSAQGEMIKTIGNNSYGKSVEKLGGMDLIMSLECPEGYTGYQAPECELQHLWFKLEEPAIRAYHQPQIGAFITAHVRMVVRRAALLAPESWLYADTDCVVYDRPVDLPIDPGKYGMWKQETAGEYYRIITKKVYANEDASEKHAKGLNIKKLTAEDFERWFDGDPPEQEQLQRQNFLKCMTGEEMFIKRTRRGEVKKSVASKKK